jgi:CheY-like chemotaxis protein
LDGYLAAVAYDGPAGIDLSHSWSPDVVLLDIGLPGVDGWKIAREIAQRERKTREARGPGDAVGAVAAVRFVGRMS